MKKVSFCIIQRCPYFESVKMGLTRFDILSYLIPSLIMLIFEAYFMDNFCRVRHSFWELVFQEYFCVVFLHKLCRLRLTCIDTECHQSKCIFCFSIHPRNLCAQLYVCTIRLYPLSTLCFCINYANEGYLHRGRVSFRLKSVIITRHTHANLKIAKKKYGGYDWLFFAREYAILCTNV